MLKMSSVFQYFTISSLFCPHAVKEPRNYTIESLFCLFTSDIPAAFLQSLLPLVKGY